MHETIIRYIKVVSSVLVALSVIGVALYKIAASNISFDVQALQTSDVLAIFLALFSVGLAVMFYFKSSEESSKFYNNSYTFTKEMSELLGRIEAGFGAKLEHIDKGYSSMGKRIDDALALKGQTTEQLKEEEDDADAAEKDRDKLIVGLMERANISEEEQQKFRAELEEKEKELMYARLQVQRYQKKLDRIEENLEVPLQIDPTLNKYTHILADYIGYKHLKKAPLRWLTRRIKEKEDQLPSDFMELYKAKGFVDEEHDLTSKGHIFLRQWSMHYGEPNQSD